MEKREQRALISDFIKSFSCSYSVTRNLGEVLGVEEDPLLLQSVVGFGSGVATMGDTCGAVSGGVVVLGKRFPALPATTFYSLCADYFSRIEKALGTPNCGRVHGGRTLVTDFRRALLTGKTMGCTAILKEGAGILDDLASEVLNGNYQDKPGVERICDHFEEEAFHCSQTVISRVAERLPLPVEHIDSPARGFCGGIGFNGTLCGAVAGAVLCLGLKTGVDLSRSGYRDFLRILLHGLVRSGGVFSDEKVFPAAGLFRQCREVYQEVESRYGGAHCIDILGFRLDSDEGARRYIEDCGIHLCHEIVTSVAEKVVYHGSN